jgi:hypothetical protein
MSTPCRKEFYLALLTLTHIRLCHHLQPQPRISEHIPPTSIGLELARHICLKILSVFLLRILHGYKSSTFRPYRSPSIGIGPASSRHIGTDASTDLTLLPFIFYQFDSSQESEP